MLDAAVNWDAARPAVTVAESDVAHYVGEWPQRGDAGAVAYEIEDGSPVGAAWYRFFTAREHGHGFVDESTPEISIAVVPEFRGHGIGTELLRALVEVARRDGVETVSLSVERHNPARRLYERLGFAAVDGDAGDADDAVTMLLRLRL